jgi:prophage DNA circulation protein
MAWTDKLQRASWRGVPFGLDSAQARYGRRHAEHVYPYRDDGWLEDQGKLPREFRLLAFLIGDSAVYGGGDVLGQLKRMERAAEQEGPGVLVHPTRGRLAVTLLDLVISERWDEGNYFELQFSFRRSGEKAFPTLLRNLSTLVGSAAGLADAAGLGDFVARVAGPLQQGLGSAADIAQTASEWVDRIQDLARDATGLYGTLSQLGGADFGRFFNGRNAGFLAGLSSVYAGASSVDDLIALGSDRRAAVDAASAAIQTAIAEVGVASDAAAVATSVQAAVASLQAATADPQDGVRVLADLAEFQPAAGAAQSVAGQATSDLFRRSATAALARVSATYAPASSDDAHAVRARVLGPVDAAVARAGVTGADEVFKAFRGLRKAVVDDLGARGGALARLVDVRLPASLPAVVIAHRRYGDASREAELVTQAGPRHPWFMPTTFRALAD